MIKKIVVINSSETRQNSHTEYALDELTNILQKRTHAQLNLSIKKYHLADFLTEIPTPGTLHVFSPELKTVIDDFFNNDLLLIGTPNKNFSPSILLQCFFQKMRDRLLTYDSNGNILSRNFYNHNIVIIISGRSTKLKWLFLNQSIFFIHFDLLFDFWGRNYNDNVFRILFRPQNQIKKYFISNAQNVTFEQRKLEISHSMEKLSHKLIPLLITNEK